ncbi:hypothetical protein Q3G72_022443 [Acer saccharum]|nr:hypothetical protein Q3G72_022443 [Acer saccharum]
MAAAKRRRISNVFIEFLRMSEEDFDLPSHEAQKSEEEYGHPSHGAITLPCDSTMFEYVASLVGRRMPEELETALITSIATCHQLASSSSLA